jgi:hypothetical protein
MTPEVKFFSIKYHDTRNGYCSDTLHSFLSETFSGKNEWTSALFLMLEVLQQLITWWDMEWRPQ